MIYVPTSSRAVALSIPRTTAAPSEGAVLTVRQTVGLAETVIPIRLFSAEGLYFGILANFSAIKDAGEYEYRLEANGLLLASGVLVAGYLPDVDCTQYDKTIEYEQYRA